MSTHQLSPRAAEIVSSSKLRAVLAFTVLSDIEPLREAHRWCVTNGHGAKADLIYKALKRLGGAK